MMIPTSSRHRKERPATGVTPKHTSAKLDGPLQQETAEYSPRSFSFTLNNLPHCEYSVAPHRDIYESPRVETVQPSQVV